MISDQIAKSKDGNELRKIIFICPVSGEKYEYITNLQLTIRPGVIAHLYKFRWDIEKVFDDFKNKMNEEKS